VTPTSPLIGDFRYASITPVTLGSFASPETFTIGAVLPADLADVWLDHVNLNLGAGFTGAGTGQFTPGVSLVYPATLDSSPYLVVNATDIVVPEPSALALSVTGLAGLLAIARRKRQLA